MVIYEDCRRRNKNLIIAWIDYQKAFDSVRQSWLEQSIELAGVNGKIFDFVNYLWRNETGSFYLKTKQEIMQSQPIQIRRGIFQGEPLSPLIFYIANILLKYELNRADCG
jgi:hypothetical protein